MPTSRIGHSLITRSGYSLITVRETVPYWIFKGRKEFYSSWPLPDLSYRKSTLCNDYRDFHIALKQNEKSLSCQCCFMACVLLKGEISAEDQGIGKWLRYFSCSNLVPMPGTPCFPYVKGHSHYFINNEEDILRCRFANKMLSTQKRRA